MVGSQMLLAITLNPGCGSTSYHADQNYLILWRFGFHICKMKALDWILANDPYRSI